MKVKSNIYSFFGTQIDFPLIEDSGHIVASTATSHEVTVHEGFEIVYLNRGKFSYQINQDDVFDMHGGQLLLTKPHEIINGKDGIFFPSNLFWILLNPYSENVHINSCFKNDELKAVLEIFKKTDKRVFQASEFIKSLFEQYIEAFNECYDYNKKPGRNKKEKILFPPCLTARIRSILCSIIIETCNCLKHSFNSDHNYLVTQACNYMKNNFGNDLNINDVVKKLDVSESYLYKLFEREIGQSPNNYLQTLRLEKAHDLILHSNLSITRIAFMSGFSSSQYFTRVFKNHFGSTPSKTRINNSKCDS